MKLTEECTKQITDHAVHGAYPEIQNSNYFYLEKVYITQEIIEWYEEIQKFARGIGPEPFGVLKQNFGGLAGVYPAGYEDEKLLFNSDYVSANIQEEWTFKRLYPLSVQETIEVEIDNGFHVADWLPYFITGPRKPRPTFKAPGRVVFMFNTRKE
jgi:hypothetical protein